MRWLGRARPLKRQIVVALLLVLAMLIGILEVLLIDLVHTLEFVQDEGSDTPSVVAVIFKQHPPVDPRHPCTNSFKHCHMPTLRSVHVLAAYDNWRVVVVVWRMGSVRRGEGRRWMSSAEMGEPLRGCKVVVVCGPCRDRRSDCDADGPQVCERSRMGCEAGGWYVGVANLDTATLKGPCMRGVGVRNATR
ncbi:hypothetical protein BD626DRAFT_520906 [Schizophyllum amplum]|uniref:Uncharacterized protein n=1 Tax=Schizophyllum amplum TaxID=97359 RepID=A0A550BU28_9AGAR|nr:hypothetical protein BD626DRAFT_520906 [Auriculariopsis ampla]